MIHTGHTARKEVQKKKRTASLFVLGKRVSTGFAAILFVSIYFFE